MFGGLGAMEIGLIMLVLLLVFGAKRLPELGSGLGRGIREFKGSMREITSDVEKLDAVPPAQQQPQVGPGEPRSD
jgi:sec-independent protein translocase protein TatA